MDKQNNETVMKKTLWLWFEKWLEKWNARQRFCTMMKRMRILDVTAHQLINHKNNGNHLCLLARGTAYVKSNYRGSTCSAPTSAQLLAMNRIGAIHIPTLEYLTTQTCAMCNNQLSVVKRGDKYLHDILYCESEICKSQRWVHRDGNAALNMARKAVFDPDHMQQMNRHWADEKRKVKVLPKVEEKQQKERKPRWKKKSKKITPPPQDDRATQQKKRKPGKKANATKKTPPPQDAVPRAQRKRELDTRDEKIVGYLMFFAYDQHFKRIRTG